MQLNILIHLLVGIISLVNCLFIALILGFLQFSFFQFVEFLYSIRILSNVDIICLLAVILIFLTAIFLSCCAEYLVGLLGKPLI